MWVIFKSSLSLLKNVIFQVAPITAAHMSNLFSIEMWGGATFDVALRLVFMVSFHRVSATQTPRLKSHTTLNT